MAVSHTTEPLAASVAGALLLAAMSSATASAEEVVAEPDVTRRPDTSSFHFASTFQGEDALRTGEWVLSKDSMYEGQESRVRVEKCNLEGGVFSGDYGLLLDEAHKHYGVGATLPKPFDNAGKDLVMQYEVQIRDGAKCGGAYVKMLRGSAGEDMTTLNSSSPYSIMFGPDKCFRDTNKVHYIFQHEHPVTKEWEEKHFKDAPKMKDDKGFHVYTLHIKTDNTFDLYIDTETVSSGNLLEDFEPPVEPPQEIDDPDEEQPEDWVTEAKIDDPTAVKPDDWDEDAPLRIVDESAEIPEGWLLDEEDMIADPAATKPDDWDDEEDGEWQAPPIVNPACQQAPGCGEWKQPNIRNPDYKGKWKAPKIDNPDYVGVWEPRKIPNPEHFTEPHPSHMAPITGLAVEIWSVDGGVWLDNFVVGDDISAALKLAEETWRPKAKAFEAIADEEKKAKEEEKAAKKKAKKEAEPLTAETGSKALVDKARAFLPEAAAPALDIAAENPIACVVTLLAGMLVVLVLAMKRTRKPARAPAPAADTAPPPPVDGETDGGGDGDDSASEDKNADQEGSDKDESQAPISSAT